MITKVKSTESRFVVATDISNQKKKYLNIKKCVILVTFLVKVIYTLLVERR